MMLKCTITEWSLMHVGSSKKKKKFEQMYSNKEFKK